MSEQGIEVCGAHSSKTATSGAASVVAAHGRAQSAPLYFLSSRFDPLLVSP